MYRRSYRIVDGKLYEFRLDSDSSSLRVQVLPWLDPTGVDSSWLLGHEVL
jgi:hypothetical protein